MHLLHTVLFYLALIASNTLAKFRLPERYHVTSLTDFGTEATSESRDNPRSPLLNTTLTCYKDNHATLLWRNYKLSGSGWYGVSEKSFKHAAANANACMTMWKFKTWNVTDCFQDDDGTEECFENLPVWHATVSLSEPGLTAVHQMPERISRLCKVLPLTVLQFRHSQTLSGSTVMMNNFEKLAGTWSRELKHPLEWTMTNGTHERRSNIKEAYPPDGLMVRGICEWAAL
jgi:hypothetical protein